MGTLEALRRPARLAIACLAVCACGASTPPAEFREDSAELQSSPAPTAETESVTLVPVADGTLIETPEGSLANGSGPALFVGRTGQGPGHSLRRALLRFDLKEAVPRGAHIVEAALELSFDMGGDLRMSLHRVTAPWGEGTSSTWGGRGAAATEGDATWSHRFFQRKRWKTPGGDFVELASAEGVFIHTEPIAFESNEALVGDLQSWLDRPAENFGWILVGAEGIVRFASREAPEEDERPSLTVTYTLD